MQYNFLTAAIAVSLITVVPSVSHADYSAEVFAPNATAQVLNNRSARTAAGSVNGIEYEVIGGHAIAEADMVLGKVDSQGNVFSASKRAHGQADLLVRWTNGIIPYQFSAGISSTERAVSLEAIAHWNKYTTVSFVELTNENRDQFENYITFETSAGCSSYVGMQGGEQQLWVSQACGFGSIIHELGHAVGLFHEHSRNDRDNYITVGWNNIVPSKKFNFDLLDAGSTELGDYDYGSIMHYGENVFSSNDLPTVQARNGAEIGQRIALSDRDIQSVNSLYETDLALNLNIVTNTEDNMITTDIQVTNQGNMGSNNLAVLFDAGGSGDWVSMSAGSSWHCESQQTELLCQLDYLEAGAMSVFTLLANANDATEATLKAKLIAKTREKNYNNNTYNDTLEAPANLSATISIANNSNNDMSNTELSAAPPSTVSSIALSEFDDDVDTHTQGLAESPSSDVLNPFAESNSFGESSGDSVSALAATTSSGAFSPLTSFGLLVAAGVFQRRRFRRS